MLAMLIFQVRWAALAIVGFCVPLLFLAIKSGNVHYDAERDAAVHERRACS